jgi:CRP-like cAMP-binding protein
MAQIMFSFFFVIHIMACSYWGMARDVCLTASSGGVAYVPDPAAAVDPFCPPREVGSVAEGSNNWTYQYSAAFYWAVWVMLGNSPQEQLGTRTYMFTAGMLVVGVAMFSTILGSASAFLSQLDSEKLQRRKDIDFVRRYMQTRKISPALQKQISDYYDYIWDTGNTPYHKQLFDQLPEQLRALMQLQLRTTLLTKVPMFSQLAKRCVVAMLEAMTAVQSVQGETVVRMGDAADCIYFVEHGQLACTILNEAKRVWVHVATIRSGQFFGEMGLFGQNIRAATVRAMSYSELQALAYADIKRLRKLYDDLDAELDKKAEEHRAKSRKPAKAPSLKWKAVSQSAKRRASSALAPVMGLGVFGRRKSNATGAGQPEARRRSRSVPVDALLSLSIPHELGSLRPTGMKEKRTSCVSEAAEEGSDGDSGDSGSEGGSPSPNAGAQTQPATRNGVLAPLTGMGNPVPRCAGVPPLPALAPLQVPAAADTAPAAGAAAAATAVGGVAAADADADAVPVPVGGAPAAPPNYYPQQHAAASTPAARVDVRVQDAVYL